MKGRRDAVHPGCRVSRPRTSGSHPEPTPGQPWDRPPCGELCSRRSRDLPSRSDGRSAFRTRAALPGGRSSLRSGRTGLGRVHRVGEDGGSTTARPGCAAAGALAVTRRADRQLAASDHPCSHLMTSICQAICDPARPGAHGAQGDGEVCGTGIEAPMYASLREGPLAAGPAIQPGRAVRTPLLGTGLRHHGVGGDLYAQYGR